MKAPRSCDEIIALWKEHAEKCEKAGAPVTHLYAFAENIGVKKEELLGAALAASELKAKVVSRAVRKEAVNTGSAMKDVKPVAKVAKRVIKRS